MTDSILHSAAVDILSLGGLISLRRSAKSGDVKRVEALGSVLGRLVLPHHHG